MAGLRAGRYTMPGRCLKEGKSPILAGAGRADWATGGGRNRCLPKGLWADQIMHLVRVLGGLLRFCTGMFCLIGGQRIELV